MILKDRIYGSFRIDSPLIGELLDNPALVRLKDISQMGPPGQYYHLENYSRWEHSVGVFLLLRHLGASEEEQVAGLLHDVSHTAFSHVIDWVVGSGASENYQDDRHTAFMNSTGIPALLRKYGMRLSAATDYKKYPLLEQDIPHLCADRIDYALREFPPDTAKKCFRSLTVSGNRIVFRDKENALLFARGFLSRQMDHWGGYEAVTRYRLFADALKEGLRENTITLDDLSDTETPVMEKLLASSNPRIRSILLLLRNKDLSSLPQSKTRYHKKFRYVDPLYLEGKTLKRLSGEHEEFAEELKRKERENAKGIRIGYPSRYGKNLLTTK